MLKTLPDENGKVGQIRSYKQVWRSMRARYERHEPPAVQMKVISLYAKTLI